MTQLSTFLRGLACEMAAASSADQSDQDLVERALARRDEQVFRTILNRHGAMVYGVCWRVLRDEHDAEDAFQATFLVLAQKLPTLRRRTSLASWLHGVANRVAMKAKVRAGRRRRHEHGACVSRPCVSEAVSADKSAEWRATLDAELARLPEKWRLPLILCYLEGRTQDEAARQLGYSRSTLRSRLDDAREALGRRLKRHGVIWPAALSAVLVSDCVTRAALAPKFVSSTVQVAACLAAGQAVVSGAISNEVLTLTKGVLKAMFVTRLKVAAVLLLVVSLVVSGAAAVTAPDPAAGETTTAWEVTQEPAPKNAEKTRTESQPDNARQADAEMHVVGLYGPKGLTGNNKRVDVEVRPTAKPVVLVLTSYFTVDWHLKLAPGARLRQIILGGWNEQTVEGVPATVPVVRCFPKDHSDRARLWFYAYDPKSRQYLEMVRKLNEMTALPVASFQGDYGGTSLVVDGKRGSSYAQKELKPPAATPRQLLPDQIRAAAAGAELHVLAIAKPREPCEPVDVEVRETAQPVVLALTSGPHGAGSATWKLKLGERARLKLVILGGWASDIEGLPAGVPVVDRRRFRSHFHDIDWGTGLLFPPPNYRKSIYLVSDHRADTFLYRRMVENLNSITALRVTTFQGEEVGTSFAVDGVKGREFQQTESDSPHATLKPQELLTAAKGCELHIVGVNSPRDDKPVDVELRPTVKPVVLVLTARLSVLWKLKLADGARLKMVILGGWSEQDIDGVPMGIPVIHRSCYPDDGSRRQDGYFWATLGDSAAYREMVRRLNQITGLPVGSFQGAEHDTSFIVDGMRGGQFAEPGVYQIRRPTLKPKELLATAAGCELHYVGVDGPQGNRSSTSEAVIVELKATAKPAVLVLASHLPVIWDFRLNKDARVTAVILGGFHKPEIDGLPKDVPVVDYSVVSSNFPATQPARATSELCTYSWGSIKHRRMMEKLNALTGLPVATCQGEGWGTSFVIDGVRGRNFGQATIKPRRPAPRSLTPKELLAAAAGAELHVVGTYLSEVGTAGQRVAEGGVVEVEVRRTDKPMVLALTSWFSVAWKLKVADKARVKAVIVGGAYEQEIDDVPADVPVVVLPKRRDSWGGYQSNSHEFRGLAKKLRKMTGLPVTTFQGTVDGISFVVDGVRGRDFAKKPGAPAGNEPEEDPLADVADIPSQELQAAGDANKRYFLIGPKKNAKPPVEGYGLFIIMPGQDGSADFNPFVRRIYKHALTDRYVVAQPIAMQWTTNQQIVWPTKKNPVSNMKFSTEQFVEAVIADVAKKHKLDRSRVFTLSWSSSGPAAYATSLRANRTVTGSFIAMSVFYPELLPPLKWAKGHTYYLYHSPDDPVCLYRFATQAKTGLAENGAKVHLETYGGGHGWLGNVYNDIRQGVAWLEENREKAK
jgi:RNA polymerase sigma factor (sigma-70 family)